MNVESELERAKRRLNEAEQNRDYLIKQLIWADKETDKWKKIINELEETGRWERNYSG